MKKLFFKISILMLFVIVASIGIRKFVYEPMQLIEYSYAEKAIHMKREYLQMHRETYNTVFMGSSHVLLQFNPILFDSAASGNENAIHSFNFGISALQASELFYFSDNLLKDYLNDSLAKSKIPLKYLFLELNQFTLPKLRNLHTTRMFYWYDWNYFLFTIKGIFESCFSFPLKIAAVVIHTIGFTDKQLNLGYISDVSAFQMRNREVNEKLSEVNSNYTGYTPMEKARGKFLNAPESITKKVLNASAKAYQKFENNPELLDKFNKIYLNKINETIKKFANQGIYVVFVFTPLAEPEEYYEIIPLLNQIDAKHKIELADSRKFPEFYAIENLSDATHLNRKGADIFTVLLAQKFNELIGAQSDSIIKK